MSASIASLAWGKLYDRSKLGWRIVLAAPLVLLPTIYSLVFFAVRSDAGRGLYIVRRNLCVF